MKASREFLAWAAGYLHSSTEDPRVHRVSAYMAKLGEVGTDFGVPYVEPEAGDFQRAAEHLLARAQLRSEAHGGPSLMQAATWCDDEARRRKRPGA